jgi:hypothetical protein
MKKPFLTLLFLLISLNFFAQTSASVSGIAVQGIARDNNNTALVDATITFKFTLYYNDPGPINVFIKNTALTTDAFGVFSYILDVDPSTNANFSNNSIFLKIEDITAGIIISDEVFKHVPYAIAANNGVPTGSIMPYIGEDVPEGWVLCNGQNLTTISGSANLRALLNSNNAPKLQGMFLRGAGKNTNTGPEFEGKDGPALMGIQKDAYESHLHGKGSLNTKSNGQHNHDNEDHSLILKKSTGGDNTPGGFDSDGVDEIDIRTIVSLAPAGNHVHVIEGETGSSGEAETRPVNYGVNYIIKL